MFFCCDDASRALYHVFSHVKPPYLGTLYHVFSIRGYIEEGASSLLNRAALRDAVAHERFLMLFLQWIPFYVCGDTHCGYILKVSSSSAVYLDSVGKDPVYYLNIPFTYDFHVQAHTIHSLMNVVILSVDISGSDFVDALISGIFL